MTRKLIRYSIFRTEKDEKTQKICVCEIVSDGNRIYLRQKKKTRVKRIWLKKLVRFSKNLTDYAPFLMPFWAIYCFWPTLKVLF